MSVTVKNSREGRPVLCSAGTNKSTLLYADWTDAYKEKRYCPKFCQYSATSRSSTKICDTADTLKGSSFEKQFVYELL